MWRVFCLPSQQGTLLSKFGVLFGYSIVNILKYMFCWSHKYSITLFVFARHTHTQRKYWNNNIITGGRLLMETLVRAPFSPPFFCE